MPPENSVSEWMEGLQSGDAEAARHLWRRYFDRLVELARRRLAAAPRRVADEEDVALSVFRSLCHGAEHGQFADLSGRDELWRLLVVLTEHKVIDQRRAATGQKRGGGRVQGDSAFPRSGDADIPPGFDQYPGDTPTPEFLATLADEHERLMNSLTDERLRRIAEAKLLDYTNGEIAAQLGITRRSVERKLQRIRQIWTEELER
jgi:DNA-directed RNA polymerase specialized sigma24 family protein